MPCNVTATRQVLEMTDLSGEKYKQYYRLPTNDERLAFGNSLYEKKGKNAVPKDFIFPQQVAFGKLLSVGFSEGYFMDGDNFISSDPSKPYFRENWKELVEAARPTDYQQIAIAVMRPASPADPSPADPSTEEPEGEEPQAVAETPAAAPAESEAPLANSSEAS